MIPPGLRPTERVVIRNSRHTRTLAAVVERVTREVIVIREIKTKRERIYRRSDPAVYMRRLDP